ncbi:MAG: hypothetical protein JNM81_17310 [Rhodospirillaceae bacterium]|nr:hypothetical protein [Rhodospirillaceae bacterium]
MTRALKAVLSAAVLMASSVSAFAADPFSRAVFDQNTMQGWQRSTGASAMAYGTVKFHPTKSDAEPAKFGVAMTAPYRVNGAGVLLRTEAPKLMDFSFNTRSFDGTWGSSLKLGATRAWTYDPYAKAGEQHTNFLDSGTSWIVVGLATVAVGVAAFSIIDNGT